MDEPDFKPGVLRDFIGRRGSGMALLRIERPDGTVAEVPCENGPTVRALRAMFGGIVEALDKPIEYAVGDWDLLSYIRQTQEVP